jgi:hypothetical protein
MCEAVQITEVEINGKLVRLEDTVRVAKDGSQYTGKVKKIIQMEGAMPHRKFQVVVLPFGDGDVEKGMEPVSIHHVVKIEE